MTTMLRHHPDDLSEKQRDRMCPACRARYRVPEPALREEFGPLYIDRPTYRWLENAAKVWDAQSTELYPASEFIAWLRFELAGERAFPADHDGAPPRNESGTLSDRASQHRHPDPIPYGPLPYTWRREVTR